MKKAAAIVALTIGIAQESPLICNLQALTPAEREQHQLLTRRLKTAVVSGDELEAGYRFRLRGGLSFIELATWADFERRCCPFFDVSIGQEREGGTLWIQLTGRPGVKDFVRSELLGRSPASEP